MDSHSLKFIDGSCGIAVAVESPVYDVGEGVIFPKMLGWDEAVGTSRVAAHDLMIDNYIIFAICGGE